MVFKPHAYYRKTPDRAQAPLESKRRQECQAPVMECGVIECITNFVVASRSAHADILRNVVAAALLVGMSSYFALTPFKTVREMS